MQTFLLILQIIPMVMEIVRAVENMVWKPGEGPAKLEATINMITAAVPKMVDQIPTLEKIISVIVGLANKTKTFEK